VKLAHLAARDAHRRDAGQTCETRADHVSCNVAQARLVARGRSEAVARDGEDSERQTLDVANLGGWRQRRGELRQARFEECERLSDVHVPIKEEADLGSAA